MSTHLRRRTIRAGVAAVALVGASLALLPAPAAQATVTGAVTGGATTWKVNTKTAVGNGVPHALASAYTAPASHDATSAASSWALGTAAIAPDQSATLTYQGTAVYFSGTTGSWFTVGDPQVTLDADGNGSVSALVSYGGAMTVPGNSPYDPTAVTRPATRVALVTLSGNTAAARSTTAAATTWTGLTGTWAPAFTAFLGGDAGNGVAPFTYRTVFDGTPEAAAADEAPAPFTFTVATATPKVTPVVTSASHAQGVTVRVDGDGFRGVTKAGPPADDGVYVGIAPSGGLPATGSLSDMDKFAVADWVPAAALAAGTFSRTLTAPTAKLDPSRSYSVYTWQAHGHSNTTQDTETPLAIDWAALKAPAATKQAATTTATLTKAPKPSGKKGQVTVMVAGAGGTPSGAVTLTLVRKGGQPTKTVQATLTDGRAVVRLPKLKPGRWTVTVTYAGDAAHSAAPDATVKVKVKKKRPNQ